MTAFRNDGQVRYQRGWAGIVMLLAALVLVGFLVRSALKQMGLSDGPSSAIVTGRVQPRSASTPLAPLDAASAAAPIDRARAVQTDVLRQGAAAEERLKAMDR